MPGIDLTIPGSPSGLYELADWLVAKVAAPSQEILDRLSKSSDSSEEFWNGRTGDAFRDTATAVKTASEPVKVYADDLTEVLRAYARRLERGADKFADLRDRALKTTLLISDNQIAMPMEPPSFATPAGTPVPIPLDGTGACNPTAGESYAEAQELYKEIAHEVGEWWGTLDSWVDEHFTPLMARVTDFDPLVQAVETLQLGNDIVRGTLLDLAGAPWENRLAAFETAAKNAQVYSDEYYNKLKAGDPRVRAAAAKASKQEVQAIADALADKVSKLKVGTKILPGVGIVVDIVIASAEVANGGSVSAEVVGILVGTLVGTGSAASLPARRFPPLIVAIAASAAALAAAEAATKAYEEGVPLDVREAIDAGDIGYFFK